MLRAHALTKRYAGVPVVQGLDLQVQKGQIVGLVGANGAGKSTTIKMLAGLIRPSEGRAAVDGAATERAGTRRRIGYLPEDSPLYEDLDPIALLLFFGGLYGMPRALARQRAEDLLTRLGLDKRHWRKPIGNLSKGMTRKVAIARTVLHDPDVLILDEPASGLDPLTVRELGHFLIDERDAGKAILLSAHNLPQVEEVCDLIQILHEGRTVAMGTLSDLRAKWGSVRYTVRATIPFPGSQAAGPVHEAKCADWDAVEAATGHVKGHGGEVLDVVSEAPRLEEILVQVAGA